MKINSALPPVGERNIKVMMQYFVIKIQPKGFKIVSSQKKKKNNTFPV